MTKCLNEIQTNEYVKKHGVLLPNGQVFLKTPLKVFKKVYYKTPYDSRVHAIASLIIPVGALVNLAQNESCKLRASEAFCWSIRDMLKPKTFIEEAFSGWNSNYIYESYEYGNKNEDEEDIEEELESIISDLSSYGNKQYHKLYTTQMSSEDDPFDQTTHECEAGIHFFVEARKAMEW